MKMEWTYVWAVVITGLVVVFLGLILLIFFVWLFGKVITKIEKSRIPLMINEFKAKKARKHEEKQQKNNPNSGHQEKNEPKSAVQAESSVTSLPDSNDDEIAAVISAAVAMMSANDGKNYKVKSIKSARNKRHSGVSAWGSAGQRENTQPF